MKLLFSHSLRVPLAKALPSVNNLREHWATKARRVKTQRNLTRMALLKMLVSRMDARRYQKRGQLQQLEVVLTRYGSRKLDDDNLAGAFKAIRDEVAEFFGVDDGNALWLWRYEQEADGHGPAFGVCVRVHVVDEAPLLADEPDSEVA